MPRKLNPNNLYSDAKSILKPDTPKSPPYTSCTPIHPKGCVLRKELKVAIEQSGTEPKSQDRLFFPFQVTLGGLGVYHMSRGMFGVEGVFY